MHEREHAAGPDVPPPPSAPRWNELVRVLPPGSDRDAALLQMLRAALLWASLAEGERESSLEPLPEETIREAALACVESRELFGPTGVLTGLHDLPRAGRSAARVAEACRGFAEWADARGRLRVAVLFADAAARADPESAAHGNHAARLCRRAALDERASAWYRRALALAVRGEERKRRANQREAISALLGYGTLKKDLGEHEAARHCFEKAARKALSAGLRRKAAEVHHDLLGMHAEAGALGTAEWHARSALKLYTLSHRRIPYLAHDYAYLLVRQNYYTPALRLLEQLVRVVDPREILLTWGTLARAAAGAGRRIRFEEAESEILRLVEQQEEYAPAARIHLAEGRRAFGEWERARDYAQHAVASARHRNYTGVEQVAQELLEKIHLREQAPQEVIPPSRDRLDLSVRDFIVRLQKWVTLAHYRTRAKPDTGEDESG